MYEKIMSLSNNNTSRSCQKMKYGFKITKGFISIFIIGMLAISFIFYMSSTQSKLQIKIPHGLINQDLTISHKENGVIYNTTLSGSYYDYNGWYVSSVEMYLTTSKLTENLNQRELETIYRNTTTINRNQDSIIMKFVNTDKSDSYWDYKGIDYLDKTEDSPNEYTISYLKITLSNLYQDEGKNIDFYHFFVNETNTSTKNGVILQIAISTLTFDANYYNDWYNWMYNNGLTPQNGYPFGIDVSIVNYFIVQNPFDSKTYWFVW